VGVRLRAGSEEQPSRDERGVVAKKGRLIKKNGEGSCLILDYGRGLLGGHQISKVLGEVGIIREKASRCNEITCLKHKFTSVKSERRCGLRSGGKGRRKMNLRTWGGREYLRLGGGPGDLGVSKRDIFVKKRAALLARSVLDRWRGLLIE